jgi:hypothetical protein
MRAPRVGIDVISHDAQKLRGRNRKIDKDINADDGK